MLSILVVLLCSLLLILLAGGLYAYWIAFYTSPENKKKIPNTSNPQLDAYREEIVRLYHQLKDRPCEDVTILSQDGLTLSGRYYHVCEGAPVAIGFHGYRSSCFTDFAGGSELSFHMGHNLLLVDQRSHGRSDGRTISFGIMERWDVLSWTNYVVQRFGPDTQILLYGVSMGASTVLMASGLELPVNVKAIIADCPYASPMDIILHVGKSNPLPQWLIKPFVIFGGVVYGGIDILEMDVPRAIANARVPILIIHGEADQFVPCCMSEEARKANPRMVRRITFPGADHALSYLTDPKRYWSIVTEFVTNALS